MILKTKNLTFAHPGMKPWAFADIALDQGDFLLILGNSGSGKTTLLHILSGLLSPTAGEIVIDGDNIANADRAKVDNIRGSKIGMVFQRPHFIKSLNVVDNIQLATQLGSKSTFDINNALELLNIQHVKNKKINLLSEGEKQRVGIARALANNPKLIFADEPTSALDDDSCARVINLLIDVSKKINCGLVVVTHDARIKPYFSNQMTISKTW